MLKEAKVCCAFAWNPSSTAGGALLACASVAGAMDDDFGSEAYLQIHKVDLSDHTSKELPRIGRVLIEDRVHRVDWANHYGEHGIIATGSTDGTVSVYSADHLIQSNGGEESDPLLCSIAAHQGPVKGCRFNPIKHHFLATGGTDRELCIWSMEDPTEPVAVPALTKSTHDSEITDLSWNVKYEHILGTTTSGGAFCLWDLRTKRMTQRIGGNTGSGAANALAWHPDGTTTVAIARDYMNPVVQIWDLKKAVAPIKELRGHTGGVTGLSWCPDDSSLLMSSGCDGRTICWNPSTGEQIGEVPAQENLIYDVAWCPRIPAVIAYSSFDSILAVHSAQGLTLSQSKKSVNGTTTECPVSAPKWLNRPSTASFGFGGRVVCKDPINPYILNLSTKFASAQNNSQLTAAQISQQEEEEFNLDLQNCGNTDWIEEKAKVYPDLGLMGVLARSNQCGSRQPMQEHLGLEPAKADFVPWKIEDSNDSEEDFDDKVSQYVACGKLSEAVDMCLYGDRFDDAFAIAYLKGSEEVKRVHIAYLNKKADSIRFAQLIKGAVAASTGVPSDLADAVAVTGQVPWKHALALCMTYSSGAQLPIATAALGDAISKNTIGIEKSAASDCYISSGDVNRAAEQWGTVKGDSAQVLTRKVMILEAVSKVQCTAAAFTSALASHGDHLAKIGNFEGALRYASRSANLGSVDGAIVADRAQHSVGNRIAVKFPFTPIQIPQTNSPDVISIGQRQEKVQQQPQEHRYQHQQQQPPVHLNQQQQHRPVNQYQQQQQQQPPVHLNQQQQQRPVNQYQYQPQQQQQPPVHPNQLQQPPPGHSHQLQQPPPVNPNQLQQPPPVHPNQLQQPPPGNSHQLQQPPPVNPNQSLPSTGQSLAPNTLSYTSHQAPLGSHVDPASRLPSGAVTTMSQMHTTGGLPTTKASPALLRGSSQVPQEFTLDVSTIGDPSAAALVSSIVEAVNKVTDKRKRDAIERAATELFKRLSTNQVSENVITQMSGFASAIGTPNSKELWKKMSDAHFQEVQPFLNLKFL